MNLHGAHADIQMAGDFTVGEALSDEPKNFGLAGCQPVGSIGV